MTEKRVHAVISDMDGTLLDTEPLYAEAAQQVINKYGNGKSYDWDVRSTVIGKPELTGAGIIVSAYDVPLSAAEYLTVRNVVLHELFRQTKPMEGAERLTRHLKHNCGLPVAVATSSNRQSLDYKLELHKKWFDADIDEVVCGDDPAIKHGKPAPDIYLLAAKRLGVEPSRCLVFEDAVSGVQAAKAAGMMVVAIPDPHIPMTTLHEARPDVILSSLAQFRPEHFGLNELPPL